MKEKIESVLDSEISFVLSRNPQVKEPFFQFTEDIFTGEIFHKDKGYSGFVNHHIESEYIRDTLSRCQGSIPLSVSAAESLFPVRHSLQEGIDRSKIQDFLQGCGNLEELDFSELDQVSLSEDAPEISYVANSFIPGSQISENIENTMNEMKGFGYSPTGEGNNQGETSLEMYMALRNNPMIKLAADFAGRFLQIFDATKRQEPIKNESVFAGYYTGNDIANIVPEEFANLQDEDLEILFYKNFAEGNLLCQRFESREAKGKGPLCVMLDVSGSMGTKRRLSWGIGLAAALFSAAKKNQKDRIFHLYIVNGSYYKIDCTDMTTLEFLSSVANLKANGGTNFAQPVSDFVTTNAEVFSEEKKADLILITDGIFSLGEAQYSLNEKRAKEFLHVFTLLVQISRYEMQASSFDPMQYSDRVIDISELMGENSTNQISQVANQVTHI